MKKRKILNSLILVFLCLFTFCLNVKGANDSALNKMKGNITINNGEKVCVFQYMGFNKEIAEYDLMGETVGIGTGKHDFKYIVVKIKKTTDNTKYNYDDLTFSGQTIDAKVFLETNNMNTDNCSQIYPYMEKNSANSFTIVLSKSQNQDYYWKYSSEKTNELTQSVQSTDNKFTGCSVPSSSGQVYLGTFINNSEYPIYNYFSTNAGEYICPATTKQSGSDIIFDRISIGDISKFNCNDWQITNNPNFSAGSSIATDKGCRYYLVRADENLSRVGGQTLEEEGTLIITYKEYNSSNAATIRIIKNADGTTYKAVYSSGSVVEGISSELIKANVEGKDTYPKYLIYSNNTYTFQDEKIDSAEKIYINANYLNNSGIGLGEEEIYQTCQELFGQNFLTFLNDYVFKIIWIGVPILLILLTSFDFAKVVFVDDKEGIQNAFRRFWKRAIASVLIFLTPYIIILIANVIGAGDTVQDCAKEIRNMSQVSSIVKSNLTK